MRYVKAISKTDQNERRSALLEILRSEGLPFAHYHQKHNENWVENIIVPINPSENRLVIGAHYDSVEGSSGANDNAAAVSILIRLAKVLLEKGNISVDLIFFDREEYANRGSDKYIPFVGKESINAMINLDVCGNGNNIAISAKGNEKNDHFYHLFSPTIIQKHKVSLVEYLPNGDDTAFDNAGIPNISIATLSDNDIIAFRNLYNQYINMSIMPSQEEQARILSSIEVMATMHNGSKDNINSVSQSSMDMLLSYLCDGLVCS